MADDLAAWRRRADPLADDAVAAVVARAHTQSGSARPDPLTSVRGLARTDAACARFVEATSSLPSWCDVRALEPGRSVAVRQAPLTFLVLLAGSLIESFAVAEGAAVLVKTGRLERDSARRIYETASLVRELLIDGEERPGGRAHEALLRVRLLHAFVRRWVTSSPKRAPGSAPWDAARLGVPVNQLDMLHTLLVFSHVVAKGLERLGARVTPDERASWCALWRLAGHVLGLDDALAFTSVDEERALYGRVRATYAPDDGSRALAHAVLASLAGEPPFFLPKRALEGVARTLLDDAAFSDRLADGFALAPAWVASTRLVVGAVRGLDVVTRGVPGGARVGAIAGRAFIELNRWRVLRTMPAADYSFRTA